MFKSLYLCIRGKSLCFPIVQIFFFVPSGTVQKRFVNVIDGIYVL